jgi:hypothetical protein
MELKDLASYSFGAAVPGMSRSLKKEADKYKEEEEKRRMEEEAAMQAKVPGMKKGGKVSSASKRADGCATKGKTRGRIV